MYDTVGKLQYTACVATPHRPLARITVIEDTGSFLAARAGMHQPQWFAMDMIKHSLATS